MLRVGFRIPASRAMIEGALEGLTRANVIVLRGLNLPYLYSSGVAYRREPAGREDWLTADQTYKRKFGDCEDLAAWRAAELRLEGIPARAAVLRTGRRRFHAVVRWPDGTIEDPSIILGMRSRRRGKK